MKNSNNPDIFLWTEAFNCGEILNPFLKSYLKHNNQVIHVLGFEEDLKQIDFTDSRVKTISLKKVQFKDQLFLEYLRKSFKQGHLGTATLWTWLIKNRKERHFIHLDADTIFLDNVIEDFINVIKLGFDLAGSRRVYKNRPYRRNGLDGWLLNKRRDCLNTDCFYFNSKKLRRIPFFWLQRMIRGRRMGIMPVVDFFDPIIFYLTRRKQRIYYFDSNNSVASGLSNSNSIFHSKRISFAAVGSGINFYKNPEVVVSPGYKSFALSSYALYAKYILRKDLGIEMLNEVQIINKLEKLNQETWELENKSHE